MVFSIDMVQVPFGWGGLDYEATFDEGLQDFTKDGARGPEHLDLALKLVWNFGVTLTVMNLPSSGFLTALDI